MHRLTLLLVGLGLTFPLPGWGQTNQTIGTGNWTNGAGLDTCPATEVEAPAANRVGVMKPGSRAYFVVSGDADGEDNVNANCDDGDRDSGLIDVSKCASLTLQFIKLVGDSNAGEGILMNATKITNQAGDTVSTISDPICADIDADGDVDCTVLNGDTGIDQDGGGSSINTSLFWDFGPLPAPFVWWDTTTSPGAAKVARVVLSCLGPEGAE